MTNALETAPNFSFSTERIQQAVVLKCCGYLNEEAGDAIKELVEELLKTDFAMLIFDFSDCPLINSSGVSALFEVSVLCDEDNEIEVRAFGVSAVHDKLFELAGLHHYVRTVASLEEAIQSVPT